MGAEDTEPSLWWDLHHKEREGEIPKQLGEGAEEVTGVVVAGVLLHA